MKKVRVNDSVKVQYVCTINEGEVYSETKDTLKVKLGEGRLLPELEKSLIGMAKHNKKMISIPCEEAYGQPKKNLIQKLDKNIFPLDSSTIAGDFLTYTQENGAVVKLKVLDIDDKSITIDCNHPLAGKDLKYEIELVDIF